jgi:hypothetical protein
VKTACQCLVRIEETQARATSRGGGTNIVEAEHSFNRKIIELRVQRKQVVFTTVVPFFDRELRRDVWRLAGGVSGVRREMEVGNTPLI